MSTRDEIALQKEHHERSMATIARWPEIKRTSDIKGTKASDAVDVSQNSVLEATVQNKMLIDEVLKTSDELSKLSLSTIDSMGLVFEQKTESIVKLRAWRKTIQTETRLAALAVKEMDELLTTESIEALSAVVDLLERLNNIEDNEIINKLFR